MGSEPEAAGVPPGMSRAPQGRSTVRDRRGSRLGVASLVLSLISVLFGFVTAIPAIILGVAALAAIRREAGDQRTIRTAIAGPILAPVLALVAQFAVYPSLVGPAGRGGRLTHCSGNLRNLNLALRFYAQKHDGQLPSADQNICLLLGPYMGDATDNDSGLDWWRCPSDRFIPTRQREFWCSYAPNAGVEETGELIGAFSSDASVSNPRESIEPDTITFVEMWTPPEVVLGHPGFFLKLDQRKPENWRRSMVEPGKELCAIRSYRTARPASFDLGGRLVDCGNYLFLRAFVGRRLADMYHHGRINVVLFDGGAETMALEDLIRTARPIDNPLWTRAAD